MGLEESGTGAETHGAAHAGLVPWFGGGREGGREKEREMGIRGGGVSPGISTLSTLMLQTPGTSLRSPLPPTPPLFPHLQA